MRSQIQYLALLFFLLLVFNACKDDCEKGTILKQRYKLYQNWYPYKEKDTLHFYRPQENDTIVLYGSAYSYPSYIQIVGCECCDDEEQEYLSQTFRDSGNNYKLQVEMEGSNIKFTFDNWYNFEYDIGGNELLYSEVITPDSVYKEANRLTFAGNTCFYAPRIGVVKYTYENNGSWLFLRNP